MARNVHIKKCVEPSLTIVLNGIHKVGRYGFEIWFPVKGLPTLNFISNGLIDVIPIGAMVNINTCFLAACTVRMYSNTAAAIRWTRMLKSKCVSGSIQFKPDKLACMATLHTYRLQLFYSLNWCKCENFSWTVAQNSPHLV